MSAESVSESNDIPGIKRKVKELSAYIDQQGRQYIARALTRPDINPWNVISKLQEELGWGNLNMHSVMEFFHATATNSKDASQLIFEAIKAKLEALIQTMNDEQLLVLLKETFPFYSSTELQAVPISIMKRMTKVPEPYLNFLIKKDLVTAS
jgi:hypothetical protein